MAKNLYKTHITIWSEYDPSDVEVNELADDAINGSSYCSKKGSEFIKEPDEDNDWDGTEFFDLPDEGFD